MNYPHREVPWQVFAEDEELLKTEFGEVRVLIDGELGLWDYLPKIRMYT